MSNIKSFIEDRNEAFASGDINKIKEYAKKYNIDIPEDEETFLIGIHKAICNLYLVEDSPITIDQFQKSFDWLNDHGYSPSITFDTIEDKKENID